MTRNEWISEACTDICELIDTAFNDGHGIKALELNLTAPDSKDVFLVSTYDSILTIGVLLDGRKEKIAQLNMSLLPIFEAKNIIQFIMERFFDMYLE